MDVFEYAHKHANEIVWMSQNTNHIPTTGEIRDAIIDSVNQREYARYPYVKGLFGLKEAIFDDLGLEDDIRKNLDMLITFGGTEGLYITMRALLQPGDEVITTDPSYLIIHHFAHISGAKTTDLPIYSPPWKYTSKQVNEIINKNTKMCLLINPLNPLGSLYTKKEVKEFCEIAEDNNLMIIDDITYRDFADEHILSMEFLPEKTITAYSVSKNCGLAGMRVGALMAPKHYIEKIRPYVVSELSVNILGQRAALVALKTKNSWFPTVYRICRNNQKLIKECVEKVDGAYLPVYPSQANMFVIDISDTGITPDDLQNKLLFEHKIFVRSGNYVSKKFGNRFIRVSFSVPEEDAKKFVDKFPITVEELRCRNNASLDNRKKKR